MESQNGRDTKDVKSEADTATNKPLIRDAPTALDDRQRTPKKRRKVNHACVYCRRSHMTCDLVLDESEAQSEIGRNSRDQVAASSMGPPPSFDGSGLNVTAASRQSTKATFDASALGHGNSLQLVQPTPVSGIEAQANTMASSLNQYWMTNPNPFQEMHSFHPNYMVGPSQVSDEFNLLNDFLHSSMLEDGGLASEEPQQLLGNQPDSVQRFLSGYNHNNTTTTSNINDSNSNNNNNNSNSSSNQGLDQTGNDSLLPPSAMPPGSMLPPPVANNQVVTNAEQAKAISRSTSVVPVDKAREYWLQAADPAGNDTPAQRMQKLLVAKVNAGLLKPFSYIKGYARLSKYLESHVAPASRQKISRQLDRFRPKFREKMQALTDMDLILVEMWFEETLMGYDRVFASMAVPACCWRRTGEIFRGNKEMAELINVPIESLRDGKIALHEILTEDSVVRYWEEFGTIAFDPAHDTLLTACSLKSPDDQSNRPPVNCCFSFMIRRDQHKIPSLIVGNFLPHDPE
ncbi:hypothetical protein DL546_001364 [Coniochaeta pulveracea]|uniref:ERT1/acuK family PAS domain-containing protein n=1 Tax=Coniochaeta pulveracea TaxID=177199 RepID=A0A420XZE1_9PEZI|nr:hypothetical protein DL546_001364 [Coniochaeta pulveracea]